MHLNVTGDILRRLSLSDFFDMKNGDAHHPNIFKNNVLFMRGQESGLCARLAYRLRLFRPVQHDHQRVGCLYLAG